MMDYGGPIGFRIAERHPRWIEKLQADYDSNVAKYPDWQAYFREEQPPTLVVWGKGDPLFGPEGARAYENDLEEVEVQLLDTGHFALEEDLEPIVDTMTEFLANHVDDQ